MNVICRVAGEVKKVEPLRLFHPTYWAIYRKRDSGETCYYEQISDAIRSEFEIFRSGKKWYY